MLSPRIIPKDVYVNQRQHIYIGLTRFQEHRCWV